MKKVDIAIIGAGPAGISAAIYAKMDNANYILIEKKSPCWFLKESINSHYYVDGFSGIKKRATGTNLRNMLINHYKRLGGKFLKDNVLEIIRINNYFKIKTIKKIIVAKKIILTSGTTPKKLNIPSFRLYKKNIHNFCTISGKNYVNKNVIIVGGRNSGSTAACYLHDIGCKAVIVELKNKIQCKEKYLKKLKKRKIKIYTSAKISKLIGKNNILEKCIINYNNKNIKISCSGLFVYIGMKASLNYAKFKLKTNNEGFLIVGAQNNVSQNGIYAAGDITCRLKQAITACGDGANAYYFAKKSLIT